VASLARDVQALDPIVRALLDLTLRRGFSDITIAEVLGIAPAEAARIRQQALDRLTGDDGDRDRVEATLRGFGDSVWLWGTGGETAGAKPAPRKALALVRRRKTALAVAVPAVLAAGLVLVLGGAGSGGGASSAKDSGATGRAAEGRTAQSVTLVAAPFVENGPVAPPPVVRAPVPVRVSIPDLEIDAPVRPVGASPAGIDVPPVDKAGWFDGGPRPGEPGRTILVGHVDSYEGPAIFATLATAATGQSVRVTDAEGSDHLYRVDGKVSVPKSDFPATRVYAATTDSTLALITCGGPFDRSTGHYENSVIVFASPE